MRFRCLLVSKEISNNAVQPHSSIVFVALVVGYGKNNEYNQAVWYHSIVWHPNKRQNFTKLRCPTLGQQTNGLVLLDYTLFFPNNKLFKSVTKDESRA